MESRHIRGGFHILQASGWVSVGREEEAVAAGEGGAEGEWPWSGEYEWCMQGLEVMVVPYRRPSTKERRSARRAKNRVPC